tara:strand:- start:165 stop:827 length:663 start_codon:yes stop_codon:yes gene_type:complete
MAFISDFLLRISIMAPGFLLAISFHEFAHAWVANYYGDPTAKSRGRLTLNPSAHYDLFGTIILPLVLAMMNLGIFGYAKPVPVDSRHFKNYRKSIFWVSFAGPLANIILMTLSALFLAILRTKISPSFFLYEEFTQMLIWSVYINIFLAVFNLIPFPPLDGSRMLSSFLSYENQIKFEGLQSYSFLFFIVLWTTNVFSYLLIPAQKIGWGMVGAFVWLLS